MPQMRTSRKLHRLKATMLLVLALTCACSRRSDLQANGSTTPPRPQHVPFHQDADNGAGSALDDENASIDHPKADGSLPFSPASPIVPVGSLLTVRLEAPISTASLGSARAFTAVLEPPTNPGGATLWPAGAVVTGRLECAHAVPRRGTGYLCLTLKSIICNGKTIPLQTSNLFVKGRLGQAQQPSAGDTGLRSGSTVVRLEKGHRLTFRLTHDLVLDSSTDDASSHFPSGSK